MTWEPGQVRFILCSFDVYMLRFLRKAASVSFPFPVSKKLCNYLAVMFFLLVQFPQPYWQPHNRSIARRIQNMGWRADGGLWLLVRGGGLYLSRGTGVSKFLYSVVVIVLII